MKAVIVTFTLASFVIISLMIYLIIIDTGIREEEMICTLDTSIKDSLETVFTNQIYVIDDTDDFMADFIESFMLSTNANYSKIQFNVIKVDIDEGIIFISVTGTFETVKGKEKDITVKKAVILEEYCN